MILFPMEYYVRPTTNSICLTISIHSSTICDFIYLFICLSIYLLFINQSIYQSINLSIHPSIYLSIYFIYVCLTIYLYKSHQVIVISMKKHFNHNIPVNRVTNYSKYNTHTYIYLPVMMFFF